MLSANNLPELGTDLVAALSSLNVKDFSHFLCYISAETKKASRIKNIKHSRKK
jgi:hypothetical protein